MDGTEHVRTVALELFAQQGFNATTMRQVASKADLTPGALYHHYPSKDAILRDIMETGMSRLLNRAHAALEEAGEDPERRLRALTRSHVMEHGEHRESAIVGDTELRALSPESREIVACIRDEYEALWRSAVEELADEDDSFDHALLRFALLQMCTGVAQWYRPTGPLRLEKIANQFCDIAVRMVLNPGVES